MTKDFTVGSIPKGMFVLSLPLMFANLLQIFYNLVDMAVVGRFIGTSGLAAVTVGGDITTLFTTLCIGFSNAGQVLVAQQLGKGDTKPLAKIIGSFLTVIFTCAIAVTIFSFLETDWILGLMNMPEEGFSDAREYVLVCSAGMIFVFGYNAFAGILRGMGQTKLPLIFIIISSVTNIVLDFAFVSGMNMGTFGAALATVIGQSFSFFACLIFLYGNRERFYFDFRLKSFYPDAATVKALLKLGIPLAFQSGAVSMSKMFVNSFINSYGAVAASVSGMGNKLTQSVTVISEAMKTSTSTIVGQNYGAGKTERIKKTVYVAFSFSMTFAIILTIIIIVFPTNIYSLFNRETEFMALALTYTPIAVLRFLTTGLRAPLLGLISGMSRSALSLLIGLLDAIVARTVISVFLGITLGYGIIGFWYGSVLSGIVPVVIGGVFFFAGSWRRNESIS